MQQLSLPLVLDHAFSWSRFFVGSNQVLVQSLQALKNDVASQQIYLWGSQGSGKTHMLQALCHQLLEDHVSVFYVDLAQPSLQPDVLEGLDQFTVVCLDNIDAVFGSDRWELALFMCYHQIQGEGHNLVTAANSLPEKVKLRDLQSRLLAGATFHIEIPKSDKLPEVMQFLAGSYGLELSQDVVDYLLTHAKRDIKSITHYMDKLHQASLQEKRRLTVPFVKSVLFA